MGVVLLVAPLIAPFLTSTPRSQLPVALEERGHSVLIFAEGHERRDVTEATPAISASQRFERGATTRRRFASKFPNTAKRSA